MFRVKRKHSRAGTSEGRDSRAMLSTVSFVAILAKALVVNRISRIARRLGAIGRLIRRPSERDAQGRGRLGAISGLTALLGKNRFRMVLEILQTKTFLRFFGCRFRDLIHDLDVRRHEIRFERLPAMCE